MEQIFGICRVSVAPMRSEPSDRAENASQLLFGEFVEVLEQLEKWWYISAEFDGYKGWIDFRQLTLIPLKEYLKAKVTIYLAPAQALNALIDPQGNKLYLSPGSNLPNFKASECFLNNQKYEVLFTPQNPEWTDINRLISTASFFLNAPYLWGGRTFFGIDCSGFVQNVFKLNGIGLRRDAWQQAEQGKTVDFLQEVVPGDVAFFDNEEGKIIHVGIMLNNTEIIHASSKVKIDPMDNQGIFNAELGKYSHKLRIIKRFI
ncbi:MAG: C40 family peptidase [Pedobacter sp.]|nr:C40 family peptidase [Pedobacter sp.]